MQLDWSSAEVSDSKLTVAFVDRTPKKWREAFVRAATLLSHDTWELNEVKPGRVRISPVRLGEEERIKHFLESAVLEANATLVGEEELFAPESDDGAEQPEDAEPDPDEELTARFRAFG
jgi:hypothetical protein